jgi:signal transduction histidine kinase
LREAEAARIGREIHDEMGQALTTLKIEVQTLKRKLQEPTRASNDANVYEKLDAMGAAIDTTAEITRRIVTELRPSVLDLGLVAALEWQAREFEARTGIFCNLTLPDVDFPLDDPRAITVFRIFQEVLTNIARHAEASEVDVRLERQAGGLVLTVVDNGRGISDEEVAGTSGFGLLGMRERALAAGGSVEVTGQAGRGTTVELRLPVRGGTQ